jgi:hypothetical protein
MDLHQAADRGYGTVHLLRSLHLPDPMNKELIKKIVAYNSDIKLEENVEKEGLRATDPTVS